MSNQLVAGIWHTISPSTMQLLLGSSDIFVGPFMRYMVCLESVWEGNYFAGMVLSLLFIFGVLSWPALVSLSTRILLSPSSPAGV
jgi:hypothetical protein